MKRFKIAIYFGLPIFLILACSIMIQASWISSFDNFYQQLIRSVGGLHSFMVGVSFLASPKMNIVWMIILAVILWLKKMRPMASSIVITLLSADAIGFVVKHLIQRARPAGHMPVDDGFSFPSGHTLGMGILVIWLIMVLLPKILKNRTTRIWVDVVLLIWLGLVMCSRVYLLAHYPSDVCGSLAFALMWVGVVELFLHNMAKKLWNINI